MQYFTFKKLWGTLMLVPFLMTIIGNVYGQLQISTANTVYLIDFDNTVDGVNNAQFSGSGFSSTPTAGQLDSDAWALTGMSDFSNLDFGVTRTTGDLARGTSTGGVSTGGVYGFTVGTSNNALGFQPGGDDWTPGNVTLRIQNQTGGIISSLHIAYTVYVRNDQGRANNFNFTHSYDNSAFTNIDALNLTSTAAADGSPAWKSYRRIAKITGLNLVDGEYYFLRWWSDDVSGSGSRDEFALDDITIVSNPADALQLSGTFEEIIIASGAETVIANDATLTVNGTLTNNAGASGLVIESTAAGTGSLIHASANVDATVQRYITGNASTNGTYDYHQVAVPLNSSGVAAMFLGSYLYKFDLATQTFQNMGTDVNTVLPNDQGYMIFYPDAHITYDFSGQLNSGPFSVPTAAGTDEFTLAPNPYPSAIDWDASSGWTKTNLYDAIWIWNPVADNYAAYGADAGTNGGTRYIPAGQAFFVKSSAPSSVLAMDNPVRVHNAQAFWKNQTTANNMIRIKTFTENASDEMIIRFNSAAMIGQDALDVEKMFGGLDAPQLYSISDERSLSINTLPFTLGSNTVYFAYSNSTSIEAVLLFEGIESLDAGSSVFLEDLITNQMIDLNQQSSYAFTYDPAQQPERFKLHFAGVTSIDDQPEASSHRMWTADGMLYLLLPEHNEEEITIDLFDLQGRLLESKLLTAGRLHVVPLSQRGMLVARVTAGTKLYTSKLFIR